MNNNLLEIIKKIIAEQGESILSEPKRISAFFADLAQDVPKPQKNAFIKCLEYSFVNNLKNVSENERANCKQNLTQKLHEEEGLDLSLCAETLDLLEMVLFGTVMQSASTAAQSTPTAEQPEPTAATSPEAAQLSLPPGVVCYVTGEVEKNIKKRGVWGCATLWLNGIPQTLSEDDASSDYFYYSSVANSVYVLDSNKVFVSGNIIKWTKSDSPFRSWDQDYYSAKLWLNGVSQDLGYKNWTNSVYVSGNNVYVAGKHEGHAVLWINSSPHELSKGRKANSVYVSGNNVYVAGSVDTGFLDTKIRATLWKNGNPQTLSKTESKAHSVYASGSDVYVAGSVGEDAKKRATLWKNGNPQTLSNSESSAYSVYASGSKVYVAGRVGKIATLWTNGVPTTLSFFESDARSVFVDGNDVYIAGTDNDKATLWINGNPQILSNKKSKANSVFIKR